jgi:L-ribulose-5-phosphate 3-epimerase
MMKNLNRREFMGRSVAAGVAGLAAPALLGSCTPKPGKEALSPAIATPVMPAKDDISIAQWALVQEIRDGLWKTLDFPRVAREEFDIGGIEFVNTLFEVPHVDYLNMLKENAGEYGVTMVLIMVDSEGDPCCPDQEERKQFGINHRKWIDIAHYLGCHSIRTNCRSREEYDREESLQWAVDSYQMLLEYASQAGINVLIENHGGVSNDADWMVRLMQQVDHPLFGSYPDWRRPGPDFDNVEYLEKMLPYAKGMSYRNQPTEELSARMIGMAREAGYTGWWGIESSGRDEIRKGKEILTRYLELG